MTPTRRLLALVSLLLGGAGVVLCVAGILGVWLIGSRLIRVTEHVFANIDSAFVGVEERVAAAGERVRAAKITTEDLEEVLKDWAKREARDRLTSRLGIEEKAERLTSGVQQADHWLAVSESSVQLVQQALELANSAGATVGTTPVDGLLVQLASFRSQLAEAAESVERIRSQTAEVDEQRPLEERIDRAVRLALRAIATLTSIDVGLGDFQSRLSEARTKVQQRETRTRRSIRIAMIGGTMLILWMALGQISLCCHGWQRLRELRSSQPSDRKKRSL